MTLSRVEGANRNGRPRHGTTALQTLLVDEGAGALLAAAAGDVASRGRGYSARTQAATVVAYHLIGHTHVSRRELTQELLILDEEPDSVYADPSEEFRDWLRSSRSGEPAASAVPSAEAITRVVPVGIWFRCDADGLVAAAIDVARIENFDAATIVAAAAAAGAVAASTHVMAGLDLMLAAAEVAERAAAAVAEEGYRFSRVEGAGSVVAALAGGRNLVGRTAQFAAAAMEAAGAPPALAPALAAIAVAADSSADPVLAIEDAAVNTGPDAGVLAGALIGARLGLRRWPWSVPNETWFAEIGRRLVAHVTELRDLPVPYAVEQRMKTTLGVNPRDELD
jgi:ADP-ribosylglycohydrolase